MFKFKRTPKNPETPAEAKPRTKPNWLKIMTIANIAIVALVVVGLSGMAIIHQSDTNPNFCAACHVMQPNVTSYMTSGNLDNVHAQAGVQCKDCHSAYGIPQEITSGVNFLVGNYSVTTDGTLPKRKFSDDVCLQCHISDEHLAIKTSLLERNPHLSHWGMMDCSECHIAHGEQIDYCSSCHLNGGQRMTGGAPVILEQQDFQGAPTTK